MNTELDPAGQAAFLQALAEKSDSGALRGDYSHADAQYVVQQDWDAYTPDEHALWRRLYQRQAKLLPGRAADVYIDSLAKLDAAGGIPRLDQVSESLHAATGWRIVAVLPVSGQDGLGIALRAV